ncbi:MAG: hypothetical protein ACKVTZ_02340 [Bacteroidia bacterium]
MRGVHFITNDKNQRVAVQIDLKTLEQHQENIEDMLDILIAESRKNEPSKSWEKVKKALQKKGKL